MQRTINSLVQLTLVAVRRHTFGTGPDPVELFPQMAELGLWGILIPEELGGAGLGYVEYVIILEELARIDPSTSLTIAAHTAPRAAPGIRE